jgi:hypothetical protein
MMCERCGQEFNGNSASFRLCPLCNKDDKEIDRLKQEGHSRHCACRIVMGDGECECNKTGEPKLENLIYILLADKSLQLCYEIEKLPASEQQTNCIILASSLHRDIQGLLNN